MSNTHATLKWIIKRQHHRSSEAFWSDLTGWTTQAEATRYSTVAAGMPVSLLSSFGETCTIQLDSGNEQPSGWVIYSATEDTISGNGYYSRAHGWGNRANAEVHSHGTASFAPLPECFGTDSQWIDLQLASLTSKKQLTDAMKTFGLIHGIDSQTPVSDTLGAYAEDKSSRTADPSTLKGAWLEQFSSQ